MPCAAFGRIGEIENGDDAERFGERVKNRVKVLGFGVVFG